MEEQEERYKTRILGPDRLGEQVEEVPRKEILPQRDTFAPVSSSWHEEEREGGREGGRGRVSEREWDTRRKEIVQALLVFKQTLVEQEVIIIVYAITYLLQTLEPSVFEHNTHDPTMSMKSSKLSYSRLVLPLHRLCNKLPLSKV